MKTSVVITTLFTVATASTAYASELPNDPLLEPSGGSRQVRRVSQRALLDPKGTLAISAGGQIGSRLGTRRIFGGGNVATTFGLTPYMNLVATGNLQGDAGAYGGGHGGACFGGTVAPVDLVGCLLLGAFAFDDQVIMQGDAGIVTRVHAGRAVALDVELTGHVIVPYGPAISGSAGVIVAPFESWWIEASGGVDVFLFGADPDAAAQLSAGGGYVFELGEAQLDVGATASYAPGSPSHATVSLDLRLAFPGL